MKSIDEAKRSNYRYLPPKNELYSPDLPIVTIIIDCYYKLDLVKQSVQSILNQDYHNVELLLIDNGAEDLVSDYIRQVYEKYKNIALIKFKENQFSWEDTQKVVVVCWNSGVLHSKGEIIGHLSYDDMLSLNCVDRMAKLFIENDKCVTAGPLPLSIDFEGNINEEFSEKLRINNSRKKYLSGKKLAMDCVSGNPKKYFSAPGGVLFVRKNIILKTGGFDRSSDITQIIKFSIYGDSGFDPKAKLYWRHHSSQLNKMAKKKGVTWCNQLKNSVKNDGILQSWDKLFSEREVLVLKQYVYTHDWKEAVELSFGYLRKKDLGTYLKYVFNTIRKCPMTGLVILLNAPIEIIKMVNERFLTND
jgi:glycosyltransferase involved in cell wall biosynthesis